MEKSEKLRKSWPTESELNRRIQALRKSLKGCVLCPRKCSVDRTAGEYGVCGIGEDIILACALPHHGEEPPISGKAGAGTIFFSSCNLQCIYCQNHQISHRPEGRRISVEELVEIILKLERMGCHNIELVTPTSQLPSIVEALSQAHTGKLDIPIVFNCGGYESPEIIEMLSGIVDIYLPDFKYGLAQTGFELSGVHNYPECAIVSIGNMIEQVGAELMIDRDVAYRGILIRHLVLPGHTDNSLSVLRAIRDNFSSSVSLSLMSQYTPTPAVRSHRELYRRITAQEYTAVVDAALEMGFDNLYIQEVDGRSLIPDFSMDHPFDWDATTTAPDPVPASPKAAD